MKFNGLFVLISKSKLRYSILSFISIAVIEIFSGSLLLIFLVRVFCLDPTMLPIEDLKSICICSPDLFLNIDSKICWSFSKKYSMINVFWKITTFSPLGLETSEVSNSLEGCVVTSKALKLYSLPSQFVIVTIRLIFSRSSLSGMLTIVFALVRSL